MFLLQNPGLSRDSIATNNDDVFLLYKLLLYYCLKATSKCFCFKTYGQNIHALLLTSIHSYILQIHKAG